MSKSHNLKPYLDGSEDRWEGRKPKPKGAHRDECIARKRRYSEMLKKRVELNWGAK
jgi:hypothetical protein